MFDRVTPEMFGLIAVVALAAFSVACLIVAGLLLRQYRQERQYWRLMERPQRT